MRPFEVLIPLLLAIYLVWPVVTGCKRPRTVNILPAVTLVVMIVHLLIEKYRWQMVPLYVFVFVACLFSLRALLRPQAGPFQRLSRGALGIYGGILVLGLFTALPALLPVPQVPALTGPYKVGTLTMMLTDPARKEIYSQNPDEPRKFMIQIWYPALPAVGAQTAPWMPDAQVYAPALARMFHLPSFFLDHLALAHASAYSDAPLNPAGGPYPVLIFSHGWEGFRAQNTFQMQELASHGYVVVGMEHPYGSVVTVFPDGQVIDNNPAAMSEGSPEDIQTVAARKLVNQWTGDMAFALDTLAQWNAHDPAGRFIGALDLEKVGVLGPSTGAGATIQFCALDSRCKAGLPMDAYMTPVTEDVLDRGVSQPFLFLFSERWSSQGNRALFNRLYSHITQPDRVLTILGTDHYDFSDLPMLSPLASQLGLKGPLNGERDLRIINDYSLAFFDWALKGKPTDLLSGPSASYPEVRYDH